MEDSILYGVDARGVAMITLNRPEVHNAFDDAMIGRLLDALAELAADARVRVLVLAANGASFSAGADANWMRRMAGYSRAENLADTGALARLMYELDRFAHPTIALVHGGAYGGGVGLAACCDIAIGTQAAKFCLSEVKLGLIPAVISPYVIAAIGARAARRYFVTAEVFDAAAALRLGLLHQVVPADGLAAALDAVLQALLQGAPGAQAHAKALVFAVAGERVTPELMLETQQRIADQRASAEGKAGLAAFLEKRKPEWQMQ